MKIAILLTGLTDTRVGQKGRDWRLSRDLTKEKVIDCFSNHEVSVYLTTYNSTHLHEIIDFYNPKKTLILPFDGSHQRTTYYQSLMQLVTEDVDFIISTRFDIDFGSKISEYPYDWEQFNFLFREVDPWWTDYKFAGDVFYAFPKKFLSAFIDSVKREHEAPFRIYGDLHAVYRHVENLIGEQNINFIFSGTHNSNNNCFYKIIRT
jgi:hypothetical protein